MEVNTNQVIQIIEELAPRELAVEGDNPGLQLGHPSAPVRKVMISLDVTSRVIEETVAKGIDLLISHHPLFYQPLNSLSFDETRGQVIKEAVKAGLNIYSAHTNLDICQGGINDYLADLLHFDGNRKPLQVTAEDRLKKLTVFVPPDHLEEVREAISLAGAGWIGNYSHCTFQAEGQGTFKPLEGSNPYLGSYGSLERVGEVRLETILPESRRARVLKAMERAHPYEEVAYDLYYLENTGHQLGLGRFAPLKEPFKLQEYLQLIKEQFNLSQLRLYGPERMDMTQSIESAALCSGSGGDLFYSALSLGAQLYITGDLKHHQLLAAAEEGLPLVEVDHFQAEKRGMAVVLEYLEDKNREQGLGLELYSAEESSPLQLI